MLKVESPVRPHGHILAELAYHPSAPGGSAHFPHVFLTYFPVGRPILDDVPEFNGDRNMSRERRDAVAGGPRTPERFERTRADGGGGELRASPEIRSLPPAPGQTRAGGSDSVSEERGGIVG